MWWFRLAPVRACVVWKCTSHGRCMYNIDNNWLLLLVDACTVRGHYFPVVKYRVVWRIDITPVVSYVHCGNVRNIKVDFFFV